MYKTIWTVVLTSIALLFGMQNFDHVPVYFFMGKAINIRLIFVIAIAGVVGYLIRYFIGISREDALKRKFQAERMKSMGKPRRIKNGNDFDEHEF